MTITNTDSDRTAATAVDAYYAAAAALTDLQFATVRRHPAWRVARAEKRAASAFFTLKNALAAFPSAVLPDVSGVSRAYTIRDEFGRRVRVTLPMVPPNLMIPSPLLDAAAAEATA